MNWSAVEGQFIGGCLAAEVVSDGLLVEGLLYSPNQFLTAHLEVLPHLQQQSLVPGLLCRLLNELMQHGSHPSVVLDLV